MPASDTPPSSDTRDQQQPDLSQCIIISTAAIGRRCFDYLQARRATPWYIAMFVLALPLTLIPPPTDVESTLVTTLVGALPFYALLMVGVALGIRGSVRALLISLGLTTGLLQPWRGRPLLHVAKEYALEAALQHLWDCRGDVPRGDWARKVVRRARKFPDVTREPFKRGAQGGPVPLWHRDGVAWSDAPVPEDGHECFVQTVGALGTPVGCALCRCPCGRTRTGAGNKWVALRPEDIRADCPPVSGT
jgi:hypothetical protein